MRATLRPCLSEPGDVSDCPKPKRCKHEPFLLALGIREAARARQRRNIHLHGIVSVNGLYKCTRSAAPALPELGSVRTEDLIECRVDPVRRFNTAVTLGPDCYKQGTGDFLHFLLPSTDVFNAACGPLPGPVAYGLVMPALQHTIFWSQGRNQIFVKKSVLYHAGSFFTSNVQDAVMLPSSAPAIEHTASGDHGDAHDDDDDDAIYPSDVVVKALNIFPITSTI